jgi:hypothetical protein
MSKEIQNGLNNKNIGSNSENKAIQPYRTKKNKEKVNYIWWFSFSLAFLGLLCTINSEVFVQNDVTIFPPPKVLFEEATPTSLNKLLNCSNDLDYIDKHERRTYIFALDTSKSMDGWEKPKPSWYDDAIKRINSVLTKKEDRFLNNYDNNELNGYKIGKIRLCLLLLDIISEKNADFVVWKFGDEIETLFPQDQKISEEVTNLNIKKAISRIKNDTSPQSMNTDFIKFFKGLVDNYPIKNKPYNDHKDTSYILVIVSDLIHHVVNREANKLKLNRENGANFHQSMRERCEKDKQMIENSIMDLSDSDLLANIILLENAVKINKNDDKNFKIFVLDYLKDNLKGKRLNYISIGEKIDKFAFDNVVSQHKISLFYDDPNYIDNASFRIKIDEFGIYKIGLHSRFSYEYYPPINFEWRVLNSDNSKKVGTNYRGNLYLDAGLVDLPPLEPREMIKITYKGHLPERTYLPYLRIYLPKNGRKSVLVPIKFVKKIPKIIVLFYYLAILFFLIMFYKSVSFFWGNRKARVKAS